VNETVRDPESTGIDRVIAMEHMNPGELKIQRWGAVEDGTTFTRRVTPGQTLFGKRRAYQRKVAYAEFEAVCSGDIYTFEADETRILGEFLPFLVQSEPFFAHALGTSAGSLSPRTNWRDLASFEFDLPPLDEQKRIADLLWAVERHRAAVDSNRNVLRQVVARFTERLLSSITTAVRLGDVTNTRSGPSFAASDVHVSPVNDAIPVIGIPNTKPDGAFDLSGVGYVTGLPKTVGVIDDASLVLIRTNGNRDRIGNVYLPPFEAAGYAVSAFQFLMQAGDPADREYLFWVLSEKGMQERMSENASGTVGLGNLAVRWLNNQMIPWPAAEARQSTAERLRLVSERDLFLGEEVDATAALKSSILAGIFGGF